MLSGLWGKKVGMTQVFSKENVVVPVTVVDFGNWVVVGVKTKKKEGYDAIQVGHPRQKYKDQTFSNEWIKKPKIHFSFLREIKLDQQPEKPFEIGKSLDVESVVAAGKAMHVFGTSKGRGFQGVVKRYGFSGGPASHGPRFGRWPGSIGSTRTQGKTFKGKKLPGHMGVERCVVKNSKIVAIKNKAGIALVKGSVPGSLGSLVFMQKV